MVLVSGATRSIPTAPDWVGRFVVPAARNNPANLRDGRPWAGDNGALSGGDADAFIAMLDAHRGYPNCLFIAAPDVVKKYADGRIIGNASATLAQFPRWARIIRAFGFPVALVLQDGITLADVPWDGLDAVFVGGSTEFKYSQVVCDIVAVARAKGKHAHMGRVAGPGRWWHAQQIGIQSCDSSGYSKFFDEMVRRTERWERRPPLPLEVA